MGKSNGKTAQTTTPNVDPGFLHAYQNGGQEGMAALGGDAGAMARMMNPYEQQVINANNAQWQHTNQQTLNTVDGRAAMQGAFGGSRTGVAEGTAMAQNGLAQQQQTAGLLYGGYNNAQDRAGQLAQLGASAPYGSTTTMSGTPGKNPLTGAVGGAQAGSVFGPWGAGIGGAIGLLGSL